jgi:phosphatidylglycerol:prolipoprotein diacylglycerol transferase
MLVPTPAFWLHTWSPFLIRFSGDFGIRYYGLSYMLGFLGAWWLLVRYARSGRSLVPAASAGDLIMAVVVGVLAGGRVGHYLLYDGWRSFPEDPLSILRVWEGGMSFHGGLLGLGASLWWYAWRSRIPFSHLTDLLASVASVGLLFGRIANFINGELWGKPTQQPWAVLFPLSPWPMVPRHPSQLYEAALEGALLLLLAQVRFWKTDVIKTFPGRLTGEYLILYAALRSFCEIFREPDASLISVFGLSLQRGVFYSLFMVAIGAVFIACSRSRSGTDSSAK